MHNGTTVEHTRIEQRANGAFIGIAARCVRVGETSHCWSNIMVSLVVKPKELYLEFVEVMVI